MAKKRRLLSSFAYLNFTQFLGALNDNIFKFLLIYMAIGVEGERESSNITALAGAIFVLPFLLFSIPSGTLADRYSKRNITIFTKLLEILAMSLGVVAFATQSVWGSYVVLFLMAGQSAIFGPSKYGIVPELVERRNISRANGILTAFTVLAMIFGTTFATALTQITHRNFVITAVFCVLIAIIGAFTSFGIEYTPPSGSKRKVSPRVVTETIRVLIRARTENYLFAAILGSAYFYFVGAFIQINIIPFAISSLNMTDVEGGYLFLVTALGIGLGSFFAGRISGDYVELGLSLVSAFVLSIFLFALFIFQHSLVGVIIVLFILGIAGGIFLVPFDAYIQAASPEQQRGENVAAGSMTAFFCILLASGAVILLNVLLGLTPANSTVVIACLTVLLLVVFTVWMSDTLIRLVSRALFRVKQHEAIEHVALLGKKEPCLVLCEVSHWWVGWIILITLHQRYMRFAVERPAHMSWLTRILARIGKIAFYDDLPTSVAPTIQNWVKRGYSVSIIPSPASWEKRHSELAAAAREVRDGHRASLVLARLKTPAEPSLRQLEISGSLWNAVD